MKNVILLTIDALRKDALGCYGNRHNLTPFLDSLQNKCIRFTKSQTTGPYTQASFIGLLTSSHYLDYGKPKGLAPERTLISEPLQKAGIVTAAFHSNPYLCGFLGWNRGWDVFYDSMEDEVDPKIPYIRGNIINSKVLDWLTEHTKGGKYRPFFLWLHYMDIHEPYMAETKYLELVDSSISISRDEMYSLFENTLLKRDVSDSGKVTLLKKLYDAKVREVDSCVQEFVSNLDNLGVLKDSIIIVTNDHGDEFNEHGGLSHDDKMYSELVDMPLFIYEPSREQGEACHNLVSNIDIAPTILYLFDLKPAVGFKGHSLLPLGEYPESGVFGEAIDQHSQKGGDISKDSYFYREGDLKVIYRAASNTWELYDFKNDPKELNNIIDKSHMSEVMRKKLRPRVRRWVAPSE